LDGLRGVEKSDGWIFKCRILFLLRIKIFNFFNEDIKGISKYSKRFSDKSNRSKLGNRFAKVSILNYFYLNHSRNSIDQMNVEINVLDWVIHIGFEELYLMLIVMEDVWLIE
jgi:hypothetical protein